MPIASVLPVLLKYLCLDLFDLDFFTVSSILVLWTEEVSGQDIKSLFTMNMRDIKLQDML